MLLMPRRAANRNPPFFGPNCPPKSLRYLVLVFNHSYCLLQYLPTYYTAHGKTYNHSCAFYKKGHFQNTAVRVLRHGYCETSINHSCAFYKKGHFQNTVLRVLRHSNCETSIRYTFDALSGSTFKKMIHTTHLVRPIYAFNA